MASKRIFMIADHGLAITCFLHSDMLSCLIDADVEVILLTDETLHTHLQSQFGRPGLVFESLRIKQIQDYFREEQHAFQWWLDYLRRAGTSDRTNIQVIDDYVLHVKTEAHARRRMLLPLMKPLIRLSRQSKAIRKTINRLQSRFTPAVYDDLLEKYRPDLVVASTPGWRMDRYALRAAKAWGVPTATVVVSWDAPSSYGLPGAQVDWISCWSEIHKQELVLGSDWDEDRVNIGGVPSYDGYFRRTWQMSRDEYFQLHNLDPNRKLIAYAASFVTYSPNIQNVEALARLVQSNGLAQPAQLLIRLHPNHLDILRFADEAAQIRQIAQSHPHIHMVEPLSLGGTLGFYSGEDLPEKSSLMAHSDVFTTIYSTMAVETSIHERPVVSVCIDSDVGWPGRFYLPLSQIGNWPTHDRFRKSLSGRVALDEGELRDAINHYLENPQAESEARHNFVLQECTYTDGNAGRRTAAFLLSLLGLASP